MHEKSKKNFEDFHFQCWRPVHQQEGETNQKERWVLLLVIVVMVMLVMVILVMMVIMATMATAMEKPEMAFIDASLC